MRQRRKGGADAAPWGAAFLDPAADAAAAVAEFLQEVAAHVLKQVVAEPRDGRWIWCGASLPRQLRAWAVGPRWEAAQRQPAVSVAVLSDFQGLRSDQEHEECLGHV